MKTERTMLLGALLLLGACRSTEGTSEVGGSSPPPSLAGAPSPHLPAAPGPAGSGGEIAQAPSPAPDVTAVPTEEFEVRVLGVDRQDASALLLGVADLTATVDGKALPVKFSGASIDLAREDQAWLVGKISVPSTARTVALALRWEDFGGVETLAAGKVVDARGPDLRWSAPVDWLRRNGHVVLHVDVAQSLGIENDGVKRWIPVHSIHY